MAKHFAVVSAVLLLGSAGYSAHAGGPLGGVTNGAGSVVHGVTGAVDGVTSGVTGGGGPLGRPSGVGSGLTGAGGGGGSRIGGGLPSGKGELLDSNGVANATVKSDQLKAIKAKLIVLSEKDLVRLCINVGGGSRCDTASRNGLIGLIATRKIKCREVVNSPGTYDSSLVKLCRLVRG